MAAETVAQAISGIRKEFPNMNGLKEQEVKKFVIERILTDLNWNLFDPKEFKPEYQVGVGRADYALNPDSPSIAVFIEVKKPAVNLDNAKHPGQLLRYCFDQTVNLGVLTNGRIWWLYLPRYEGPQGEGLKWAEKRFCEIDITSGGPAKIQKEFNTFLAKENVLSGGAIKVAKDRINGQVETEIAQKGMREAWNNVLTAPSEDLIKLLTESTASLCGVKPSKKIVTEFFQNHRAQFKASSFGHPQPKPVVNGGSGRQNGKLASFTFKFKGDSHSVSTWELMLVKLCELIYIERQDEFDQIMSVQGANNKLYFSRNPDDLDKPELIGDSGIFAATGRMKAARVEERCRKVLLAFHYGEDCFRVE